MSLFGYIYDKDTRLSSDSEMIFDTDYVRKISNFIDEKVKIYKSQWKQNADYDDCAKSNLCASPSEEGKKVDQGKLSAEQVKRFDLSPKNSDIVEYCKSLINIHFHGQSDGSDAEALALVPPTISPSQVALSEAVKDIDELLRTVDRDFSGEEEEFSFYIQACFEARNPGQINERRFRRKFNHDAKRFVQLYQQRSVPSEELSHNEYWASRQQLLSGKVVADWIDPDYGPLDPVFGILLNPTLGRTGPGDSGWVHKILFDDSGPMAYHSAVHDAFGYLITYHDVGPGYDYLGAWSLFESKTCMSGQLSGIKFWRDVLKDCDNIESRRL